MDGRLHGPAVIYGTQGEKFEFNYEDGRIQGPATYFAASGAVEERTYCDGVAHGPAALRMPNGDTEERMYEAGTLHGIATFISHLGDRYDKWNDVSLLHLIAFCLLCFSQRGALLRERPLGRPGEVLLPLGLHRDPHLRERGAPGHRSQAGHGRGVRGEELRGGEAQRPGHRHLPRQLQGDEELPGKHQLD